MSSLVASEQLVGVALKDFGASLETIIVFSLKLGVVGCDEVLNNFVLFASEGTIGYRTQLECVCAVVVSLSADVVAVWKIALVCGMWAGPSMVIHCFERALIGAAMRSKGAGDFAVQAKALMDRHFLAWDPFVAAFVWAVPEWIWADGGMSVGVVFVGHLCIALWALNLVGIHELFVVAVCSVGL